ncbi:MAG: lytic transglycosylase domain-containing protein [bacterium]
MNDDGGLVLFFSGTLIALLLGVFLAIRPGPQRPDRDQFSNNKQRSVLQFRTNYPNLDRLASLDPASKPYLNIVKLAVRKHASTYQLDPLLVLALIKHESAYNLRAVSPVGAAGPMQFMPATGRDMGLAPVYSPDLLQQAEQVKDRARSLYSRAVRKMQAEQFSLLPDLIDRWKELNTRQRRLFTQYRRRLKQKIEDKSRQQLADLDQRFLRKKAVLKGVKYLAELFAERNGDVRESLAAYNAGPGSVRRYNGIPPYNETVQYQNRIVNTYQRYSRYLQPDLERKDRVPALSSVK